MIFFIGVYKKHGRIVQMKTKKCKLMFFVYIMGQGGAEKVILNILNSINRKKYDIYLTLGVREGNTYLDDLKDKEQIKINYLDVPLGNNEMASQKLAEYLDKLEIDILFTEAYFTNTLAYQARKKQKSKKKVKLIFREATFRSKREEGKTIRNILKTFIMYNFYAKKIIAISGGVKKDLIDFYHIRESKIVKISNPVDIELVREKSNEKINDSRFEKIKGKKIINVARLVPPKDQKTLIEAFKIVSTKVKNVSLILVGAGYLETELKELCQSNGLDNVYFFGFQTNPHKYVKNSDLFVLSSKVEGFGNVLNEAMVIGTPIISTNFMSIQEEILDYGKSGLLVPIGDKIALSDAIIKMLNDSKMCQEYTKNAKKHVSKYGIKNIVKQYEKIIDEVFYERS